MLDRTQQPVGNFSMSGFCVWAGIGKTTAYREIAEGRLIARKCLGKTLIGMEDAEAWRASLPRMTPALKTKDPIGGA